MSTILRAFAEGRGFCVRVGDGESLGSAPYGPDDGEAYIPLRLGRDGGRGFLSDATGRDGEPFLVGILFSFRPAGLARRLRALPEVLRVDESAEDVAVYVRPGAWTDALSDILRPRRRPRFAPEDAEKRAQSGRDLAARRWGRVEPPAAPNPPI